MTVYVEVEVDSEEVAETLDQGTIIFYRNEHGETITGSKVGINAWETLDRTEDGWDYLDKDVIGWTALVPVDLD